MYFASISATQLLDHQYILDQFWRICKIYVQNVWNVSTYNCHFSSYGEKGKKESSCIFS